MALQTQDQHGPRGVITWTFKVLSRIMHGILLLVFTCILPTMLKLYLTNFVCFVLLFQQFFRYAWVPIVNLGNPANHTERL